MKVNFLNMLFLVGFILCTVKGWTQVQTVSQKKTVELKRMTWSTSSDKAREIAFRGSDHPVLAVAARRADRAGS